MAFYKLQLSLCQHKWKLLLEITSTAPWQPATFCSCHEINIRKICHRISANTISRQPSIVLRRCMALRNFPCQWRRLPAWSALFKILPWGQSIGIKRLHAFWIWILSQMNTNSKKASLNWTESFPPCVLRKIDPFLCGLFDDPDEGIYLRWTNEITLEARQHEDLSAKRPDICITSLHGMTWMSNHGYGEAKSAAQGENNYLICHDLLRIAIFCKNALDVQNMEGVLGLQIIGRTITFYILVLPATGLYIMYEPEIITIPSCLDDWTKLIMDMPRALRVLDAFNRICNRSVRPSMPMRHRPTISSSAFNHIFSSSQDCKRSCHVKYRQN